MARSAQSKIKGQCAGKKRIPSATKEMQSSVSKIVSVISFLPHVSNQCTPPKCGSISKTKCEASASSGAKTGCCTATAMVTPVSTWLKPVIPLFYAVCGCKTIDSCTRNLQGLQFLL